jgi:hypothetical protein
MFVIFLMITLLVTTSTWRRSHEEHMKIASFACPLESQTDFHETWCWGALLSCFSTTNTLLQFDKKERLPNVKLYAHSRPYCRQYSINCLSEQKCFKQAKEQGWKCSYNATFKERSVLSSSKFYLFCVFWLSGYYAYVMQYTYYICALF